MGDTVVSINDSITVTAAGKDNGTIKRYLWAKYGRVYSDTTTADSLKIAYPDSGRYVVRVIAIDDDGVYSLADSSIIRVTLGSPEVTSMHDTVVSLSTTSTALVNVQAKDINLGGSIQKYYWDINNNGWDDSTDSPSYMVASTAGGVVVVRWAVRDNDGLFTCDTFTVLFNRPPSSVTLTSPTSNTSWVTYDYSTGKGTLPLTLSATDPDGASDSLWFILFTGTASNSLIQIYSGKASSCTIPGIDSSSNVYYRLVVKDFFGDSGVCAGSFVAPFPLPPPPQGMVLIPAKDSSFSMGYDSWDMKPVHTVSFTHDFWMDTTEVTQNDFAALMGFNPSKFPLIIKGPVENVTWFDAALYCNKRSKRDGLDTVYTYTKKSMAGDSCTGLTGILTDYSKNGYRLPTEAEWEYACRAGTSTTYYWGSGDIDKYAWFNANSGATIRPVAQKLPNHFGLYDMSGNAWEWCNDYYGSYKSGAQTDPHGPLPYFECVIRGGAWNYNDDYLSSTNRSRNLPHNSSGFRCVRLQVI
jgi:formylglycine-generating enzyme required for sulfatase activity